MISGKSFSAICKWVVDPRYPERETFRYSAANDGDWVFVNGDYLGDFLRRFPVFPVNKRFIIVLHNTDRSFGIQELAAVLSRVHHIYAINTVIRHPKVTTIPLGFVDKQLVFLHGFKGGSSEKPYEIYMNFTEGTNAPKRLECARAFENDHRVVRTEGLTVPEYYMDLCRSKFVLCPEGTGIDTHRVYEALFCGATPVVLRNSLSHLYEKLPVCIVDTWMDPLVVPEHKKIDWSINSFL